MLQRCPLIYGLHYNSYQLSVCLAVRVVSKETSRRIEARRFNCSVVTFLCNLFWGFAFLTYDEVKIQEYQTETTCFVNKKNLEVKL